MGIDEYLTRTDAAGARTLVTDALGSTVALTDATGGVQTQYTYEPFGATAVTGPTDANAFQYTGRENDGTGLYYYPARYYHPGLHRFISNDPIGLAAGDTNLYVYVRNMPLRFVDPWGLQQLELVDPVMGPSSGCIPNCTTVGDVLNWESQRYRDFLDAVTPTVLDGVLGALMGRVRALEKGMPPGCCFVPRPVEAAPPSPPMLPRPSPPSPQPPRSKSGG